jgi:hypothetical protein
MYVTYMAYVPFESSEKSTHTYVDTYVWIFILTYPSRFPVKGLARKHVQNVVNKYLGKEE